MKTILLSFALAVGAVAAIPIVAPEAAPRAAAAAFRYVYAGGLVYVYLYEWPGIYVLVGVYPAVNY
jgi:hypothetical protein